MPSLHEAFMQVKKYILSVHDYMQHIKQITYDLALIKYPLSDDELTYIRSRDIPISFQELHDKLFDQETSFHRDSALKNILPITVQYTQQRQHGTFMSPRSN